MACYYVPRGITSYSRFSIIPVHYPIFMESRWMDPWFSRRDVLSILVSYFCCASQVEFILNFFKSMVCSACILVFTCNSLNIGMWWMWIGRKVFQIVSIGFNNGSRAGELKRREMGTFWVLLELLWFSWVDSRYYECSKYILNWSSVC